MEPHFIQANLIQEPKASSSTRFEDLQPLEAQASTIFPRKDNQTEQNMKADEFPVIEEDELTDYSKYEHLYSISKILDEIIPLKTIFIKATFTWKVIREVSIVDMGNG